MISVHSETYRQYLNSEQWRVRRARALHLAGSTCADCDRSSDLTVHHLTYDRLGSELDEDLVVLCPPCHERADVKRAADTKRRAWESRVDAWATKRWGDDWQWRVDFDEAEEEFEEWLEEKGYAR